MSDLTAAGVDKLPWRRRLGSSFSRIIGNKLDERRSLVRLFLSLYTGQDNFIQTMDRLKNWKILTM